MIILKLNENENKQTVDDTDSFLKQVPIRKKSSHKITVMEQIHFKKVIYSGNCFLLFKYSSK